MIGAGDFHHSIQVAKKVLRATKRIVMVHA